MSQELFSSLESQYELPAGVLDAMWAKESNRGKAMKSPKGAVGHFQFMPSTAEQYGVDPMDLTSAATGAAKYLSDLKKQFGGNIELALAAYNAGPGNVRKYGGIPPFKETLNYVTGITGTLNSKDEKDVPSMDKFVLSDDGVPPMGLFDFGAKKKADKTEPSTANVNWQAELEKASGILQPLAGSVVGSIGGAAAGGLVGVGPAGAIAGGLAGGGVGTFFGALSSVADHPAPWEEKLEFALKQAGIDVAGGVAFGVLGKVAKMALKDVPPSAIEAWFQARGVKPQIGGLASMLNKPYRVAHEKMTEMVEEEIGRTFKMVGNFGNKNPTEVGTAFKAAHAEALANLTDKTKGIWALFKEGTLWGNMTGTLDPSVNKFVQDAIRVQEKQKVRGVLDPQMAAILDDLKGRTSFTVDDLIQLKRGLSSRVDYSLSADVKSRGLDSHVKGKLLDELDAHIRKALSSDPKALASFERVNKLTKDSLSALNTKLIGKLLETDPGSVAEFAAKNASPQLINELRAATRKMTRLGAMSPKDADILFANVQRNWIEQNFNSPKTASEMWKRLLGTGKDKESVETFNALMATNPQLRKATEQIAELSHFLDEFAQKIPKDLQFGGAGSYVVAGAVGSAVGGSVGGASAVASLFALTNMLPKALAKAALTDDKGIINKVRYVSGWMKGWKPPASWSGAETGAALAMPQGVALAVAELKEYLEE